MGPINWIAVILAAGLALVVDFLWYDVLFRNRMALLPRHEGQKAARRLSRIVAPVVMLVASVMMGHNFARVGVGVLAVKPWLYWMMSGGLALAFVIPAVWLGNLRHSTEDRQPALLDCGFWLIAYLAMGSVFWLVH